MSIHRYRWTCPGFNRTGVIEMTPEDSNRGLGLGLNQEVDEAHLTAFKARRGEREGWCDVDIPDTTDEGPI